MADRTNKILIGTSGWSYRSWRNDRLIAVPRDSHRENADKDARNLPKPIRKEIEKFFVATDELEDKDLNFLGWMGPKTGEHLIDKAAKQFSKANGKS